MGIILEKRRNNDERGDYWSICYAKERVNSKCSEKPVKSQVEQFYDQVYIRYEQNALLTVDIIISI